MHFHSLLIQDVRRETPACVSIALKAPEGFEFLPGQYLTFRTEIDGQEVRRSYSICSAPHEGELRVAVKQVEGGLFSTWANNQIKPGDRLDAMPPQGRFTYTPTAHDDRLYVGFAAGSGITPILSILKSVLEQSEGRFILFYGNRSFDQIIFREELETLKNRFPERFSIHHILSRESLSSPLFQGRIDADKCNRYARVFFQPAQVERFFVCGPESMTMAVKNSLEAAGVPSEKIKLELFTTAGAAAAQAPTSPTPHFEATVKVIQDGMEFDFIMPSETTTLLDAAMRAGADLPFSCKGGVCSTCKARILEGQVNMKVNYGLEPDEVEAGYVLTCQSYPKSDHIVVSFDA